LKKFFDASPPLLNPADLVITFTKRKREELALPPRAIITFDSGDLKRTLNAKKHRLIDEWTPFRWIYGIDGSNTAATKSHFGGPNVAALVEELSAFGVQEFILWGYCGGIGETINVGDVIIAKGALREDGTSYHYLDDRKSESHQRGDDRKDISCHPLDDAENGSSPSPPFAKGGLGGFPSYDFVYTDWFDHWTGEAKGQGFQEGLIWSCDAIYRETRDKVLNYRKIGISAVEMEVASFYAVCKLKGLKGIALLVVSDSLKDDRWTPGFHTKPFRQGVKKLAEFITTKVIM
jgi:uridine phosphorylase